MLILTSTYKILFVWVPGVLSSSTIQVRGAHRRKGWEALAWSLWLDHRMIDGGDMKVFDWIRDQ